MIVIGEDYCRQYNQAVANDLELLMEKVKNLEAENAKLQVCRQACFEMIDLMEQSTGVNGLHLNGDEADWDWLLNRNWLPSMELAMAIAKEAEEIPKETE